MITRQDAEDIANGDPLSGPEGLVDRIYDALLKMESDNEDAKEEAYNNGHEDGSAIGAYAKAIEDMQAALEKLA